MEIMETFYDRVKTIEKNPKWLEETVEYRQFVKTNLEAMITGIFVMAMDYEATNEPLAWGCYKELEGLSLKSLSYMLIFLKKYNIMIVYTTPEHTVCCKQVLSLSVEKVTRFYKIELAYVKSKKDVLITKPSIFERLEGYATMEERQAHIKELSQNYQESLRFSEKENAYNKFIMDRENGLYRILEQALIDFDYRGFVLVYNNWHVSYNFIKEFCDKYGIEVKSLERNDKVNKDLLNIKTIDEVRYLFQCFFGELQKIEHYSKGKAQLWEESRTFVSNNKEWLEKRNGR